MDFLFGECLEDTKIRWSYACNLPRSKTASTWSYAHRPSSSRCHGVGRCKLIDVILSILAIVEESRYCIDTVDVFFRRGS